MEQIKYLLGSPAGSCATQSPSAHRIIPVYGIFCRRLLKIYLRFEPSCQTNKAQTLFVLFSRQFDPRRRPFLSLWAVSGCARRRRAPFCRPGDGRAATKIYSVGLKGACRILQGLLPPPLLPPRHCSFLMASGHETLGATRHALHTPINPCRLFG